MDQAEKTMHYNLHQKTGKTLEEWIALVKKENLAKHGQIMTFLKTQHGFTHGFANMVALKSLGTDAGSVEDKDVLITAQYKGKEHFLPIYEQLMASIKMFGEDVEIAPKKANVSLRRKKQFALLHPVTKTRFEIGINLKGQEPQGKLKASGNAMCSHTIHLSAAEDIDEEVIDWIKKAYDHAG
ncbi:DUF5655 domain-containing protein [Pararhodonellum marinum]|uniref:DUF5655 domain-containing protein n=1 Tax=Pararhodonellum marinum TaxID=2755358 RepID=UPI00188F87D5|nr:DUF5655 domain-containing protein [Pararhodonellum marinum]